MTERSGHRWVRGGTRGFSFVEIIIVVALLAGLASLAGPPVVRMRERAALQNGRHMVTSALSLTRASGVRWGRNSVLRVDPVRDELRVVVDTGDASWGADTLVERAYPLGTSLRVQVRSDPASFCFNSRGVATLSAQCSTVGGEIVLRYGAAADTLVVTSVGRVRR